MLNEAELTDKTVLTLLMILPNVLNQLPKSREELEARILSF